MRTEPIQPTELREWLIQMILNHKKQMDTLPEDQKQPYRYAMHAFDIVRQHFLQDLSLYDEPTAGVMAQSLGVTHTGNIGTTTPKKEI